MDDFTDLSFNIILVDKSKYSIPMFYLKQDTQDSVVSNGILCKQYFIRISLQMYIHSIYINIFRI